MANRLLLKRSATADKVPLPTDLTAGELAINTADGTLFAKKDDGTVVGLSISNSIWSSDTPPTDKILYKVWFNTITGKTWTWYDDGVSSQWVQDVAQGEGNSVGIDSVRHSNMAPEAVILPGGGSGGDFDTVIDKNGTYYGFGGAHAWASTGDNPFPIGDYAISIQHSLGINITGDWASQTAIATRSDLLPRFRAKLDGVWNAWQDIIPDGAVTDAKMANQKVNRTGDTMEGINPTLSLQPSQPDSTASYPLFNINDYNGNSRFRMQYNHDGSDLASILKLGASGIVESTLNFNDDGTVTGTTESGSNANGSFIKFADGTLICYHTIATINSGDVTWTFPIPFIGIPFVQATVQTSIAGSVVAVISGTNLTGSTMSAWNSSDVRQVVSASLAAFGLWK